MDESLFRIVVVCLLFGILVAVWGIFGRISGR